MGASRCWAGWTVALHDDGGDQIAATVTDALGSYRFPGLAAGTYIVRVTDTANVLGTLEAVSDFDGFGTPDESTTTVDGSVDDLNQDFGYAPRNHDPADGVIGDTVFLDRNGNGAPNIFEGLEGVVVELYDALSLTLLASTATSANGGYLFADLDPAASYEVRVDPSTLPAGGTGLINSVDPDGGGDDARVGGPVGQRSNGPGPGLRLHDDLAQHPLGYHVGGRRCRRHPGSGGTGALRQRHPGVARCHRADRGLDGYRPQRSLQLHQFCPTTPIRSRWSTARGCCTDTGMPTARTTAWRTTARMIPTSSR